MQGSMEEKKILKMVSAIKKDKEEKEEAKNRAKQEAQKGSPCFINARMGVCATRHLVKQEDCKSAQIVTMFSLLSVAEQSARERMAASLQLLKLLSQVDQGPRD